MTLQIVLSVGICVIGQLVSFDGGNEDSISERHHPASYSLLLALFLDWSSTPIGYIFLKPDEQELDTFLLWCSAVDKTNIFVKNKQ